MRDIVFEAACLRDAVLVGLVHERRVPEWATELLAADIGPASALAEVLSVPVQLSPIREALRAFGDADVPSRVTVALLTSVALEPMLRQQGAAQLLRVLSDIRRLAGCPANWNGAIADFDARAMIAGSERDPLSSLTNEILAWLDDVRQPAHFLVTYRDRQQAAAFVAELSRTMAAAAGIEGEITFEGTLNDVWFIGLDEIAWTVARDALGPLPVAGTIPYPGRPQGRRLLNGPADRDVDAQLVDAQLSALG